MDPGGFGIRIKAMPFHYLRISVTITLKRVILMHKTKWNRGCYTPKSFKLQFFFVSRPDPFLQFLFLVKLWAAMPSQGQFEITMVYWDCLSKSNDPTVLILDYRK